MLLPKTKQALDDTLCKVVPKLIGTVISVKFWFCLVVIIAGLVQGGVEGFTAAVIASGAYTGAKAYQNVQFRKIGGGGG